MLTTAIFPGTFDPLTLGHLDIAVRASGLCEHLIIAVGTARDKQPIISQDIRIDLIKQSLPKALNITVAPLSGLLVDFAKHHNSQAIIRGVRNSTDFNYEAQLQQMNASLAPGLETILLMPRAKYAHISSTLVKDVIAAGANLSQFVPEPFIKHLTSNSLK